jgi:hypothetical protein
MSVKDRIAATREEGVAVNAPQMRCAMMGVRWVGRRTGGSNKTSRLSMTSAAHPRIQGQKGTCPRSKDSTSAKAASKPRSISRDACFEWELVDQERADSGREPWSSSAFLESVDSGFVARGEG